MRTHIEERKSRMAEWREKFGGTPAKVMIVDDDPTIRDLWTAIVMDAMPKATVVHAIDGETAVLIAETIAPDVMVMDIQMSGMGGLTATTKLKAKASTARIPIIAVTGSTFSTQDILNAGCDRYMTKPVDPDRLIREILGVLRLVA
jgi:CheY-like chemotaxis protein